MALTRIGGAVKSDRIFDTVADMAASKTVKVGDIVEVAGYYSVNDGGHGKYEIVAAATGTDDGGSFIDLDTLQAKAIFEGAINVKRFGVTGDGTADDTSKIQAAIAAQSSEGTITCVTGETYLITSFSISKKININLNGATLKGAALGDVGITATENFQIYNGNSDNVWLAWSSSNVTRGGCKNVSFTNPTYSAVTAISSASGVVVEECYFTGRASGPTGTPGATTYPAFQITTGANNCKFINNICDNVEAGITADGINTNTDNLVVSGNRFKQLRFYALKTDVGNYFKFEDNYVEDCRYGIFYANDDTGGVSINRTSGNQIGVLSNVFKDVTASPTNNVSGDGAATGCFYVTGADNPYTRVVFRDNFMTGCDIGYTRTAGHTVIEGNHFYDGYSLYDYFDTSIKSGALKIIGNTIDSTKELTTRGNDLEGEPIKAAIMIGSTTQDGGSLWVPDVIIRDNTFKDCHTNCIQVARVAAAFPQIAIKDNIFDAGANTVNNINISTATGLTITGNRVDSAVSGVNIKYPNTSRIGLPVLIENNEWQFVSAAPSTGTHLQGTVFRHNAPAASGNIGWVITTTGDLAVSGVVKSFGTISA
jgi:nitrous oxidase accessory protein NosD